MIRPAYLIAMIFGLVVAITAVSSAYVVAETEQVIITFFGEPLGKAVTEPGIHFKIPFLHKANRFDKRFLEWDGDPNQIPTKDKRFIWVNTYARWRITDPLLFFQRVRNERSAQSRLDDILDGETRNIIANNDLVELIRSSNRDVQKNTEIGSQDVEIFTEIKVGRHKITRDIIETAAPKTLELGIELLDLRFKRIKYVEEVQQKIFERMISERNRIAEQYRSEGQGEAAKIMGNKERELKKIQSEAFKEAEEIRGKADAKATSIYASAYNKTPDSREFYRFLKTMETYEKMLNENDILMLSTKNELFKFFQNRMGK